jgi:HSP20 family molecular chaperone IbpA
MCTREPRRSETTAVRTYLRNTDDVLSVVGRIDFSQHEKMQPVYTEYNVGHYRRSFSLAPSSIDEHKISADMKDGLLTLQLPKAEGVKAWRVQVT